MAGPLLGSPSREESPSHARVGARQGNRVKEESLGALPQTPRGLRPSNPPGARPLDRDRLGQGSKGANHGVSTSVSAPLLP